ncbi:helix-turn-helix domain-containing protein [Parvularcula sp. IMCC14364]|uniref:helix-turn-helix domain-containing protein n=1 Tax=Parvularcula sp. IMCC14364 TaxID=3067902 RepID=UPI0027429B85|nr:helix-turn-helix domain-containing protein [Parvularcula sp. IMCC14364]
MSETLKKPAFPQYRRKSNRAVTTAHEYIETAAAEALTTAGHKAPLEVAKALRFATDAFDDLASETLERATLNPVAFDRIMKEAIREAAKIPSPERNKGFQLGEVIEIESLSAAEARQPFSANPEVVSDDDEFYAVYSTTEAAKKLNITRPTAIDWIKSGKLIGIQGAKRGWRIPVAQIRRGRLAPALQEVSAHFDDPEDAWHFLVTEQQFGKELVRPLDLLFQKKAHLVIGLAKSYGSDFL